MSGEIEARTEPTGDAVCWLHLLCESCGALIENADSHRPGCAAALAAYRDPDETCRES
jgi:hypothetical protein